MKKIIKGLVTSLFLFVVLFQGCTPPGGSGSPDFIGTWLLSVPPLVSDTMTLTSTTYSQSTSGILNGTMNASIDSYDTEAGHIHMTITARTGFYTAIPVGTILYTTYEVSGNEMMISTSDTSYPATAESGPYIKQ